MRRERLRVLPLQRAACCEGRRSEQDVEIVAPTRARLRRGTQRRRGGLEGRWLRHLQKKKVGMVPFSDLDFEEVMLVCLHQQTFADYKESGSEMRGGRGGNENKHKIQLPQHCA